MPVHLILPLEEIHPLLGEGVEELLNLLLLVGLVPFHDVGEAVIAEEDVLSVQSAPLLHTVVPDSVASLASAQLLLLLDHVVGGDA